MSTDDHVSKLNLGPVGVVLHGGLQDWDAQLGAAPELEAMGYSAIWLAGGQIKDLSRVGDLVRATQRVPVGTGIIPVSRFPAPEVARAYAQLQAADPDRFVVGLGGANWPSPLRTLGRYLDHLDQVPPAVPASARMLAALGPRMLELARGRTAGAVPLLVTPDHTAQTRALLGDAATLAVLHYVVVDTDPARAREAGRGVIGFLSGVSGYGANLRRMGFTDDDVTHLSERMVDALVAWGDPETIAERVREHLAAGADHVALVVLNSDGQAGLPTERWRQLAEANNAW